MSYGEAIQIKSELIELMEDEKNLKKNSKKIERLARLLRTYGY